MKKPKFICTIVVFIAISLGVILFFPWQVRKANKIILKEKF